MSTIRELAEAVQAWHTNATGQLQQILDAPADTEIRLGTGDDPVVLTGDKAKGFRAGIQVALSFVGKLPFEMKVNEPAAGQDNVAEKVMRITAEQLGLDESEVKPEHNISEDLGADELDRIELCMAIEEEFEIDISDEEYSLVSTVQEAIELARKKLSEALV